MLTGSDAAIDDATNERKLLVKVEHKLIDAFSYPLFIFSILTIVSFILAYLLSIGPGHENFMEVLIGCLIIALILFLVFSLTALRLGFHKDEILWLVDSELEYQGGYKVKFRKRVTNITEILLQYWKFSAPIIVFKTKDTTGLFWIGIARAFRKWCTPEELERIGIEIWKELRKINPEIKLKRKFYTTGYREEYYDGEKWVPEPKESKREVMF